MRHPIDPKVDCVFKALLGAESNRDLLIHLSSTNCRAVTPVPVGYSEPTRSSNPWSDAAPAH
ncbi:hypothetical protein [uncultured Lamprocystis sp.]|jgi:hypothetical protein|uniref:hypothetical protein n=1 Tax=uncultured Lamprocystis sp. TaxID=543132 RepID=UPI0025E733B1|nr:hypothetical protein [uncultured Lamprocystis sp.]